MVLSLVVLNSLLNTLDQARKDERRNSVGTCSLAGSEPTAPRTAGQQANHCAMATPLEYAGSEINIILVFFFFLLLSTSVRVLVGQVCFSLMFCFCLIAFFVPWPGL